MRMSCPQRMLSILLPLATLLITATGFAQSSPAACPSSPASLTSPAEGATVSSPVTLDWTDVPDAVFYRVNIRSGDFAVELSGPSSTLRLPLPSGLMTWTVTTFAERCATPVSSLEGHFRVSASEVCGTETPVTRQPADNTVTSRVVSFEWSAVPRATSYAVVASINGSEPSVIGTTQKTSLLRTLPVGAVTWRVQAFVPGCDLAVSSLARFTVRDAPCPSSPPVVISPVDGTQNLVSPVQLTWSPAPGAARYRVWIAWNGGTPTPLTGTTESTILVPLPLGSFEWFVETIADGCAALRSGTARFSVAPRPDCPTTGATPVTPANNSTGVLSPVTFSWTPAEGAIVYSVIASVDGRSVEEIGRTRETSLVRDLAPGPVTWAVRTVFEGCAPVDSPPVRFAIAPPPCPSPPTLLAPVNDATTTAPVDFQWAAVDRAERYRVWVSIESREPFVIGETTGTNLSRLMPPGNVEWTVEALVPRCGLLRSARGHFTIERSADCPAEPPMLLAPSNGAVDVASPVDFSWSSVPMAFAYQLWLARQDGPFASAGVTRSTSLSGEVPAGGIRWFVQALIPGCDPVASSVGTFTAVRHASCNRLRPSTLSPPDGARTGPRIDLAWTPVPGSTGYEVFAATGDEAPISIGTTALANLRVSLPPGSYQWFVEARFDGCPPARSAPSSFAVETEACALPGEPFVRAPGEVLSGRTYTVRWAARGAGTTWEVQESATPGFESPETRVVSEAFAMFQHVASRPTPWYYRVRGISDCLDATGPYSPAFRVVVLPAVASARGRARLTADFGNPEPIVAQLHVDGVPDQTIPFTASADQPWLSVTPASGTIPPAGLTLELRADPTALPQGSHTATVSLTPGGSAKRATFSDTPPATIVTTIPVAVSVVTPVTSTGKSSPRDDSLIVLAVAHAGGVSGAQFVSDVRVTNLSTQVQKYELYFTASGANGTIAGKSATIQIESARTMALDDILRGWFGAGSAEGETSVGVLEIRPVASSSTTVATTTANGPTTIASSRTYNETEDGTLGQFVPAIPYSSFAGKGTTLSLQQVAESDRYRTNVGLVEASGTPASVRITARDAAGVSVSSFNVDLLPGEHRQRRELFERGIALTDGRIEVEVTSETGRVTAYASVLDSVTSDPMLVSPVATESVSTGRLVLPGVADLPNGNDRWRSDVRILNASAETQPLQVAFFPLGSSTPLSTKDLTLAPGEMGILDDALSTLFGLSGSVGALHVTTQASSRLVATARTFNLTEDGTYGQFIPAVTSTESVGVGDRAIQILQLEQSESFRTNLGVVEVTGNPVSIEVIAYIPGQAIAPVFTADLAPFEMRQYSRILESLGFPDAYNVRLSIRATKGSGRVAAYGSMIDSGTEDPTYVPAQ